MKTRKILGTAFGVCLLAILALTSVSLLAEAQSSACGANQQSSAASVFDPKTNTITTAAAGMSSCSNVDNPAYGPAVAGGGTWTMTTVFNAGFMIGMALGPGQNDDVNRLYSTNINVNTVKEFTFDDNAGAWSNTSNISLPFYSERALELAAGRNDDTLRLYVGEFFGGGNAREYTWNGSSWDAMFMPSTGQQLLNLVLGPVRGDGVIRAYFSTGSSPPNNVAREFSFTGTVWTESPIPAPDGTLVGNWGIAFGDGRNDGTTRLYAADLGLSGYALYEFTWNGAGWEAFQIAPIPSQIMGVAVGDGRNDGVNRVYTVSRAFGVLEYTFDGSAWSQTAAIPVGAEIFDIALGSARNDGINRLYVIKEDTGTLYEASFDGAAWSVAQVGATGGTLFHVRVGVARNDQVTRVYVAGNGGLFEFEANAGAK